MLDTTTMHGFKSAAKNLKKSLLGYETEISLSSSQNLLAQTLGAKNYNIIKVELEKEESLSNTIINELKSTVEKLKQSLVSSEGHLYSEHLLEAYNFQYQHYRDENNYFLSFRDSEELSFRNKYKANGIVISKTYFGSVRSQKKEEIFIPLEFDKDGFSSIPLKEKGLTDILKGMSPTETKLHEIKMSAIFNMKNISEFESIELTINVSDDVKLSCIINNETKDMSIFYRDIKYKGFENNIVQIKELSEKLGLSDKHPMKNCDCAIEAIKKRGKVLGDYAEEEVTEALVEWMMESVKLGSLDAIEQFKVMALSHRGSADIESEIFPPFFNTHKVKIQSAKPINLTFIADEAEMSKFDIVN